MDLKLIFCIIALYPSVCIGKRSATKGDPASVTSQIGTATRNAVYEVKRGLERLFGFYTEAVDDLHNEAEEANLKVDEKISDNEEQLKEKLPVENPKCKIEKEESTKRVEEQGSAIAKICITERINEIKAIIERSRDIYNEFVELINKWNKCSGITLPICKANLIIRFVKVSGKVPLQLLSQVRDSFAVIRNFHNDSSVCIRTREAEVFAAAELIPINYEACIKEPYFEDDEVNAGDTTNSRQFNNLNYEDSSKEGLINLKPLSRPMRKNIIHKKLLRL